eukprot:365085-Chlamydomonas_euryale.AAC.6
MPHLQDLGHRRIVDEAPMHVHHAFAMQVDQVLLQSLQPPRRRRRAAELLIHRMHLDDCLLLAFNEKRVEPGAQPVRVSRWSGCGSAGREGGELERVWEGGGGKRFTASRAG